MKIILTLILWMFWSQILLAQNGDFVLNHYDVPLPPQEYIFKDMEIDGQGRLLLAYKKGILQFDGNTWAKIKVSSSPIKFLNVNDKKILLARDGIYELVYDQFHNNRLERIIQTPLLSPVVDLIYFKNSYYLLADEEITVFDEEFNKIDIFQSNLGYKDIFIFENRLYAFEDNYLVEYVDETWVDLNLVAPENTDFVFSIKGVENLYFSYDNGEFYEFNGKEFKSYSPGLNEYLMENYPLTGKYFDGKIIISTLIGGVVIVNEQTGEIITTIQNYNGLPTNEVNAITMDEHNGLWIAHPYGLSRTALDIPIRDIHFYPGLEGLPETVSVIGDTLWVGTTKGLFFLKEVKDYESLQKKLIQKVKLDQSEAIERENAGFFQNLFKQNNDSDEQEYIDQELKKFRRIYRSEGARFKTLKEKLSKKEQQLRDSIENAPIHKSNSQIQKGKMKEVKPKYKTVIKTVHFSRLKSIKYEYQKVESVSAHVQNIIKTDKGLIVRSNSGIYLVRADKALQISSLRLVKKIIYQPEGQMLWISNSNGLFSIDLNNKDFTHIKHSDNIFHEMILKSDQLSALGVNMLEIFNITDSTLQTVKKLDFDNNFSEEMLLFYDKTKLKLLSSEGIFMLDETKNSIVFESRFDAPIKYFVKDQNENIWLLNADEEWTLIQNNIPQQLKNWLRIVPLAKNIFVQNDSLVYLVTKDRIVKWEHKQEENYHIPKTFIDGVVIENELIIDKEVVILEHGQNNLKIVLSTPEYLFNDDVVYQYYVEGLMDDWSNWSSNREINFPYIPTGDYVLEIRAKTLLSDKVRAFDFKFEVLPPYWQTWWFYMLEIGFFSILILVSIKLNTSNQSSYLTKTFTFLTLILILEFFATIAENNIQGYFEDSPVFAFMINAVLALSISPIEKGVNKLLVKINSARSKVLTSEIGDHQKIKITETKN